MNISFTLEDNTICKFSNQEEADYWCHMRVYRQIHMGTLHGVRTVVVQETDRVPQIHTGVAASSWVLEASRRWWARGKIQTLSSICDIQG